MGLLPLSKGAFAIVDDEDYEFFSQWKWCLDKTGYAIRSEHVGRFNGKQKQKKLTLHREIMKPTGNQRVDHINLDKLDNRRSNLRLCTAQQNQMNRKSWAGSSKYKGVSWTKSTGKWYAYIMKDKKSYNLGHFSSEEDAALAYNFAAIEKFGDFARLNT